MGGVLIVVAASIGFLTTSARTLPALTIFGTMLACGAIGFLDDLTKLRHRRSLGLSGRLKMVFLIGIAAAVGVAAHHQHLRHHVFVPIVEPARAARLGFLRPRLLRDRRRGERGEPHRRHRRSRCRHGDHRVVHADGDGGDGLHPLAAICTANRIPTRLDAAYIGAAVIGAAIGFLWFNAFPAEVFMGDTGSMAMGGAIGAMAVFLQVDLLLLLVGGIFVIEALSVIAQVLSFKWWGRRIFLMAPLHHHFEMKAWSETKIMVRFWIVTGHPLRRRLRSLLQVLHRVLPVAMKALVYGLARSGQAVVERLTENGDEVVAVDRTLGNENDLALLDGVDVLVKSPGVPGERPLVVGRARARDPGVVRGRVRLPAAPGRHAIRRRHGHEREDDHDRAAGCDLPRRRSQRRRRRERRHAACVRARRRLGRLRALVLPARGRRDACLRRRGAAQPRARPSRPSRDARGLPRREAAHLRAREGEGRPAGDGSRRNRVRGRRPAAGASR